MARGILLRRYEIAEVNHYHLHGFRLKVDVAAVAGGMIPEIFVFKRLPPNPDTGVVTDEFQTVASFVDVSEWPVGSPDPAKGFQFFRKDSLELDLRSSKDYSDTWSLLTSLANDLCLAMDRADALTPVEEQWLGSEPVSDSDSVSS